MEEITLKKKIKIIKQLIIKFIIYGEHHFFICNYIDFSNRFPPINKMNIWFPELYKGIKKERIKRNLDSSAFNNNEERLVFLNKLLTRLNRKLKKQ